MGGPLGDGAAGDGPVAVNASAWSIDHISGVTLGVREMAESVAFYRKLGFDVSFGGADAPFTTMRGGRVSSTSAGPRRAAVGPGIA